MSENVTCRAKNLEPKPKMYGVLVQWAQYNEFVENESKNWVLMNWSMASIGLKDNQAQIRDIEVYELSIRGGHNYCILITVGYWDNLDCYSVFSLFFWSPSHEGSSTFYNSFMIILTLFLLIIWIHTWLPIPLDTPFSLLWVVVTKAVLFRGFLHINAVRKVVTMHIMR